MGRRSMVLAAHPYTIFWIIHPRQIMQPKFHGGLLGNMTANKQLVNIEYNTLSPGLEELIQKDSEIEGVR